MRPSWDEFFMGLAEVMATRATCDRKHVGCVIVRDHQVLSSGYNGSIRGLPHCDDEGHQIENDSCVRTIHAEANAIIQAARNGVRIDEAHIYVTHAPCWNCFKMIAQAGIKRIVHGERLISERCSKAARDAGINILYRRSVGGEI